MLDIDINIPKSILTSPRHFAKLRSDHDRFEVSPKVGVVGLKFFMEAQTVSVCECIWVGLAEQWIRGLLLKKLTWHSACGRDPDAGLHTVQLWRDIFFVVEETHWNWF